MRRLQTKHLHYAMLAVAAIAFFSWLLENKVVRYYEFTWSAAQEQWGSVEGSVYSTSVGVVSETVEGPPYAVMILFQHTNPEAQGTVTIHDMTMRNVVTGELVLEDANHQELFKHGDEGTFVFFKYGFKGLWGTLDIEHVPHVLTMEYTIRTEAGESTHTVEFRFEPTYREQRYFRVWEMINSA